MSDAYKIQDQSSCYFLTLQVVFWRDVFTRQRYRDIVVRSLDYCRRNKNLEIYAYVIMTNHIHLVVRSQTGSLSATIRDLKKYTAQMIIQSIMNDPESRRENLFNQMKYAAKATKRNVVFRLWTHENHTVELDTDAIMDQRIAYIHENPVREEWVDHCQDWIYSSARNYNGDEGIIEIDIAG